MERSAGLLSVQFGGVVSSARIPHLPQEALRPADRARANVATRVPSFRSSHSKHRHLSADLVDPFRATRDTSAVSDAFYEPSCSEQMNLISGRRTAYNFTILLGRQRG
eukprot:4443424-Pleurochrysis_carterae.AAC.2